MKRVGLIDNLSHINSFLEDGFQRASAAQVMAATGGNTGNVAFVFGARKILNNPLTRVGWGWTPKVVRERFDHLVVCCANQVGRHVDLGGWADRVEQFGLPITLFGLGAQSDETTSFPEIPAGTRRFLEVVKSLRDDARGSNISVRGNYTRDVLAHIGIPAEPTGCPSLFICEERELGSAVLAHQTREKPKRVAVAAGNPWHRGSAHLERVLVRIADEYGGEYILQHPESMLQFAYGERGNITTETRQRFLDVYGPRFDFDSLLEWYRHKAVAFVDAPNWMRFLKKFDVVLGPRYHGVALGVQAGIPGAVITIDSRTQELCDGTAIKNFNVAEVADWSIEQLLQESLWNTADAARFDGNRRTKAIETCGFLDMNGLEPSDQLLKLAR